MTLTVDETQKLILAIINDAISRKHSMQVEFDPADGYGPYYVYSVEANDEFVVLNASDEDDDDTMNLSELFNELITLDKSLPVYVTEAADSYCLTKQWELDGNYVIYLEEEDEDEKEEDFIDLTKNGARATVSAPDLRKVFSQLSNKLGRVFLDNGDEVFIVDTIHPRFHDAVLQVNQVESHVDPSNFLYNAPNAGFFEHCLNWKGFDETKNVYAMICDDDYDAEFFNITGYLFDEDDFLHLQIEPR